MSELIQKQDNRATIRWKLLTGASALALTAYVSSGSMARAEDADQPQVWIELGGQLSRHEDSQEIFTPSFETMRPSIFSPSEKFEKPPLYSIDETGKISFQPENSDWIFSASIRYGRSTSDRHAHQQTYPVSEAFPSAAFGGTRPLKPNAARFADTNARTSEQHAILDFDAGKDVGLGLLGNTEGSSTLSLGVRIAQFRNKTNAAFASNPDWHFHAKTFAFSYYGYAYAFRYIVQPYHSNAARFGADRKFRGVGPSLSWNASMPFAGTPQDGELTLDWGLSAAMLFGRQKVRTQHQTTERYHTGSTIISAGLNPGHGQTIVVAHNTPPASVRSRSVTVPNVGGFVGLSYRYTDAKLSFGYRYDTFLNAMDTGIDVTKKSNVTFNGPYASISVGLGD